MFVGTREKCMLRLQLIRLLKLHGMRRQRRDENLLVAVACRGEWQDGDANVALASRSQAKKGKTSREHMSRAEAGGRKARAALPVECCPSVEYRG